MLVCSLIQVKLGLRVMWFRFSRWGKSSQFRPILSMAYESLTTICLKQLLTMKHFYMQANLKKQTARRQKQKKIGLEEVQFHYIFIEA